MAIVRRFARLIWGDDVDAAIRPVLTVTLVASMASSTLWTFTAIWAIEELDGKSELPLVFVAGALLSAVTGYAGGWLSDRLGRRKVILFGEAMMIVYPLVLLVAAARDHRAGLAALAFFGAIGSLGNSVAQAMVADLVSPERRASAYTAVRVAANFGVVMGPPLGGMILLLAGWNALFVTVSVLSAGAFLVALQLLPRRGTFAPAGPPERGSFAAIVRDRPFVLFLGSAIFAWIVYVAYEIVLPVSLVDGYGYDAATWGFLVWINPFLVTFCQVRLMRAVGHLSRSFVMVAAMLVMGLPFLLFLWSHSLLVVIVVLVLFVIGEMLWVPTSQTIVADLAPEDIRGAYMGAFGSGASIGFALTPLIGFQTRNSFGDGVAWATFAGISVVAAVLAVVALALGGQRSRTVSAVRGVSAS
jgi:MFS family permease